MRWDGEVVTGHGEGGSIYEQAPRRSRSATLQKNRALGSRVRLERKLGSCTMHRFPESSEAWGQTRRRSKRGIVRMGAM